MRGKLWIALALLTVPLTGCAEEDAGGSAREVRALDNEFEPATMDAITGATVTWTNEGDITHSVEIRPENGSQTLHAQDIQPGASTSYTFEQAGTFEVWCKYHGQPGKGMAMTVTVHEGGSAQG